MSSGITYHIRKNEHRGGSDELGWLEASFSFSVPGYPQKEYPSFGALKVVNEDRIKPHTGFGWHPHREFEIFSYLIAGQVEHKDTMHNTEILKRGDIQLTSAGTGMKHIEMAYGDEQIHALQIWATPSIPKLTPKYYIRHFTDDDKKNKWARVVAPIKAAGVTEERDGFGPAPIQAPLTLFATLLDPTKSLSHVLETEPSANDERKVYVQVVQLSGYNTGKSTGARIKVNGQFELGEGDGLFANGLAGELTQIDITNVGDKVAEVVLFEVGDN